MKWVSEVLVSCGIDKEMIKLTISLLAFNSMWIDLRLLLRQDEGWLVGWWMVGQWLENVMVSRALPRYFTRCIVGEMQLIRGSIQVHMGIGGRMKRRKRRRIPSI